MRDIKRIRRFCNRLAKAWEKWPDMRFGQLMINIFWDTNRDPFFCEEDEMIEIIEKWVDENCPLIRRDG